MCFNITMAGNGIAPERGVKREVEKDFCLAGAHSMTSRRVRTSERKAAPAAVLVHANDAF
jgi:hypothetical protein